MAILKSIGQRFSALNPSSAKKREVAADATLAITDVGYTINVTADGKVITLPSTVVGYAFTVVNDMADGACAVTISPAAADLIAGVGFTAADNKDIVNTKATAKKGDYVKLLGDGANGWFVLEMVGIWARET